MNQQDNINKIAIFEGKKVRRILHNNEWWFSVVDICDVLTESLDAGAYWRKLKQRLNEDGSEIVTNCHDLKLMAPDGKMRETDCANTEGIFRIIQSIPSKKAEPFKRWLAKAGGDIAGGARKELEERLRRSVVTKQNFLNRARSAPASLRASKLSEAKTL